jgi:hypothetical protein
MNIELARELKQAGYPQEVNLFYWIIRPSGNSSVIYGMPDEQGKPQIPKGAKSYAAPMLSELIEACGDGFEVLSKRDESEWLAISKVELPDKSQGRLGKTPEEAVARLWLALNSKNNV